MIIKLGDTITDERGRTGVINQIGIATDKSDPAGELGLNKADTIIVMTTIQIFGITSATTVACFNFWVSLHKRFQTLHQYESQRKHQSKLRKRSMKVTDINGQIMELNEYHTKQPEQQ